MRECSIENRSQSARDGTKAPVRKTLRSSPAWRGPKTAPSRSCVTVSSEATGPAAKFSHCFSRRASLDPAAGALKRGDVAACPRRWAILSKLDSPSKSYHGSKRPVQCCVLERHGR